MSIAGQSPVSPPAPDEIQLVSRLRTGDPTAYEELVRTYGGRMLAVARRMLGNDEDAADALQEAFLSAYRAIASFEGTSKLGTWLHRIVVNAALMRLRSRSRHQETSIETLLPSYLDNGHPAEPAVDWSDSAYAALARSETQEFVRDAIATLPDNYRIVLTLRDIEGLSTEEAAQALGVEPNAAKVRLHRARQALRTLIDQRFRSGSL